MNPRHGEVWLVDMGMAAKTRPAVVLIADNLNAPRSLVTYSDMAQEPDGNSPYLSGSYHFLDFTFPLIFIETGQ